jgi:crossover junction endodeoxyribonuclease RuvC
VSTLFDLATPAATTAAGPRPLDTPTVYGLDLSLTCTGISDGTAAEALVPGDRDGHDRLEFHRRAIRERIPDDTSLVVIEGVAMSVGYRPGVEEMTYLRGLIRHDLWRRRIPFAICPPQHRIIYACGVANPAKDYPPSKRKTAAKGMVRDAVISRYGVPCEGRGRYDQADATVLAAMGLHWLGYPLAVLPDTHRRALDGVTWPLNIPAVAR